MGKTLSGKLSCEGTGFLLNRYPFLGYNAKSADPVQMPPNVASELGLHCLITEISTENAGKIKKQPPETPKTRNGLIQMIRMDKSICQKWLKKCYIEAFSDMFQATSRGSIRELFIPELRKTTFILWIIWYVLMFKSFYIHTVELQLLKYLQICSRQG